MDNINPNLIILLHKLVSDEKLAKKFSECKTLDEFYDHCSNITSGYMKEELHELLMGLSLLTLRDKNDKIMLENDLEKVSGGKGVGNIAKKYMSGILATLSLASVVPMTDFNTGAIESNDIIVTHKALPKEDEYDIWERLTDDIVVGSLVGAAVYYALNASHNSSSSDLGLPNMGASCYINATIQQLYSLREFRERIKKDTSTDKKVAALKQIFSLIDKGEKIKKSDIVRFIKDLGYNGRQQDATEFLLSQTGLGEILSEYNLHNMFSAPLKLEEASNGTLLVELLKHGGNPDNEKRREYVREELVSAYSFTNEELNRLFSKISGEKLSEKRTKAKKSEKEMVDEAVDKLNEADRIKIDQMHLDAGQIRKFNNPVEFTPVNGQFGIVINRTLNTAHGNVKSRKVVYAPDTMQKGGVTYRLTGSVVHQGHSINSGHYYSYKIDSTGQWLCYNDSNIYKKDPITVQDDMARNGVLFIYTALA